MGQARGVCWSLSVTKGVLKTDRGKWTRWSYWSRTLPASVCEWCVKLFWLRPSKIIFSSLLHTVFQFLAGHIATQPKDNISSPSPGWVWPLDWYLADGMRVKAFCGTSGTFPFLTFFILPSRVKMWCLELQKLFWTLRQPQNGSNILNTRG